MIPDIATARAARLSCRNGAPRPTAGLAPGLTQCNLIALPRDWAWDFLLFAQRNPKPCPVLDVTDPGSARTALAPEADLRTDIPLYRIWRDGVLAEETPDATAAWAEHPDLVSFLIGCSFTFEAPLQQAGIEMRHIAQGCNVPMFLTNRACRPAGRLHGPMVVSMRPIPAEQFMANLLALCLFPFAAQPMLRAVMGWGPDGFERFTAERKRTLADFFLNALRP